MSEVKKYIVVAKWEVETTEEQAKALVDLGLLEIQMANQVELIERG